jgi:hypothetical protein
MNFRYLSILLFAFLMQWCGVGLSAATSHSEPPLVVYGKVFKSGAGGRYQLFSGTLHVKLVNLLDPHHVIPLNIPLQPVGPGGLFSYRVSIDQETLPAADRRSTTLAVSRLAMKYSIQTVTVDGYAAELLDPNEAAHVVTGFSRRGEERRLDFKADVPLPDTDLDGLPDWWESLYGFNPLSHQDAAQDPDGDGLANLKEFLNSTDPRAANTVPLLQDTLLVVTAGGSAGIYLPVVDTDTPAANVRLALLDQIDGLAWHLGTRPLAAGTEFSYADVLEGRLSVEVAAGFQKASLRLSIKDLQSIALPAAVSALQVEAFSPGQGSKDAPDLWLDAGSFAQDGPVEEWSDRSANRRDGYQPEAGARPRASSPERVGFHDSQFFYVDDRELRLGPSTFFMAFGLDGETDARQTLFSSTDMEVSIGGPNDGPHGRSLSVQQNGRTINGPVADLGEAMQLTLHSGIDFSTLRLPDEGSFVSQSDEGAPLSTFTTIGARQLLSSSTAENFLKGSVREVLIYNKEVTPEIQSLIEDYQLSRWQGMRVWNYRSAALPVKITGADGVRNSLSGGEGDDDVVGGNQSDILSGGTGRNRLAGKGSADRFRFTKTGSHDVVADFSPVDGDTIDLAGIFAGMSGLPSKYVKVVTMVTRGPDNKPRVDTRLELNYDGTGAVADQTITLEGVSFGSSDLPRLIGEGNLQLGGPQYDTSIALAIADDAPASPSGARRLVVRRSGNADAAIEVPLSLGGEARVDVDYQISGAFGAGGVRRVALARGAKQAIFDLVPVPGRRSDAFTVAVTALPVVGVSEGGASVDLTLWSPSSVAIQTVRHLHSPAGLSGLVRVSRTGRLDQAFEVPLVTSGSLISGVNFQALPAVLQFASGEAVHSLTVTPMGEAPSGSEVAALHISLAPNSLAYDISSGETSVLWLSQGDPETALSFAAWSDRYFPGHPGSDLASLDSDDDGKSNLLEYMFSSDPTRSDSLAPEFDIVPVPEGYEVRWSSRRAFTDVRIALEEAADLVHWTRSALGSAKKQTWLPDGRIQHSYFFRANPAVQFRFFHLRPEVVPALGSF